jgi:hypothetical protein
MATTKERRVWLAANGHPELEKGKGRIPAGLAAEADEGIAQDLAAAADWGPGAGPDAFVEADDPEPPEEDLGDAPGLAPPGIGQAPGAGAAAAEERPQRPQRPKAARPAWPWSARAQQPKPARPKPKHKRLTVAPLIEDTCADLAWAARGIPPLQRLLYAEAPIMGVILDPHVKDTVADRVLQPVARNYERSKVAAALVGTPAFLMSTLATAPQPVIEVDADGAQRVAWEVIQTPEGPQQVMRMTPATPQHMASMLGLRYCVKALAQLSGDAMTRVQARAAENESINGQVDDFMGWLLGVEVPPDRDATAAQDGAAAGLRLAGVNGQPQ